MPKRTLLRLSAILGAALACGAAGCGPGKPQTNVLLIVVDTLRVDRLGCYGNPRGLTPNLDALAASGVRFERCSSHAPWTLPSFASLFTSLYPPEHGAGGHLGDFRALPESARTLAEVLRDSGRRTAAITNVDFLGPSFGLAQGFAELDAVSYESNEQVRRAGETVDHALAWLKADDHRPFFLFVHLFDPHAAYDPPQPFRDRFALPEDRGGTWTFGTREQFVRFRQGELALEPHLIERAAALYDGEVAYTDAQIGRLLAGLKELDLADSTLVVFTADHGEEFLDHGSWEHGHTLYEELLHVPLILSWPGHVNQYVSKVPARHIDVAPTVCELLDLPLERAFRGVSLTQWAPDGLPTGNSFANGSFLGARQEAWREGRSKLIASDRGGLELFELEEDAGERTNLAATKPNAVESMAADLEVARKAMALRAGQKVELTDAESRRLKALGYTDGQEPKKK